MTTIDPLNEEDLTDEHGSKRELEELRADLERRCAAAKIPLEKQEGIEEGDIACRVGLPSGRDRRWIYCWGTADYERLLDIPFEKYVCLQGLEAICDYSTGQIEAAVKTLGVPSTRMLYRRLFGVPYEEFSEREATVSLEMRSPDAEGRLSITLGPASESLEVLTSRPRLALTLRRDGLAQHDQALELLGRASDSIFFQIDLLHDIPLTLARERRPTRRRNSKRATEPSGVSFPAHEYDPAPVSLYWYARSAVSMPLLQFLAFYQVIEFYFPTYSQAEARRKVRGLLKDPTFRVDRDADLGRLLSSIHVNRAGAFGDERSQLKSTLQECVDADDLRQFIAAEPSRSEFLASKTKGLCDHKIPVGNLTADLRLDVAERVYEIRCKIVHTKTDAKNGEFDLLLPFSKEAEQLSHDIDLVQYLAQQVLIAASTPFQV